MFSLLLIATEPTSGKIQFSFSVKNIIYRTDSNISETTTTSNEPITSEIITTTTSTIIPVDTGNIFI